MSVKVVKGDLLDASEQYIAHQCNCCTTRGKHLAEQVFKRFPFADVYSTRKQTGMRSTPGTIVVLSDHSKSIVNMFGQYYPGKSKYQNDTYSKRLNWFKQCLDEIASNNITPIAMPYKIGCGAAGGDWKVYRKTIEEFAKNNNIDVVLYKLK